MVLGDRLIDTLLYLPKADVLRNLRATFSFSLLLSLFSLSLLVFSLEIVTSSRLKFNKLSGL